MLFGALQKQSLLHIITVHNICQSLNKIIKLNNKKNSFTPRRAKAWRNNILEKFREWFSQFCMLENIWFKKKKKSIRVPNLLHGFFKLFQASFTLFIIISFIQGSREFTEMKQWRLLQWQNKCTKLYPLIKS